MCARTLAAVAFAAIINLSPNWSHGDDPAIAHRSDWSQPQSDNHMAFGEGEIGAVSRLTAIDSVSIPNARKATTSPLPATSEIVTVDWESSVEDVRAVRKPAGAILPFDVLNCPVISWDPSTEIQAADIPHVELLPPVTDVAPEPQPVTPSSASPSPVPAAILAELNALAPAPVVEPVAPKAVATHNSYVADLMSLVPAQPAWVEFKAGVLDLSPGESQPVYLDELQALAPGPIPQPRTSATGISYSKQQDEPMLRYGGVYQIPRPAPCDTTGEKPTTELFRPMSEIDVNTASTSPPRRPEGTDFSEVLNLPTNDACAYLDAAAPGYYFTPTRFGVARPNRNTFAFYHNPLYFEDANLERCGQSRGCLTTLHSATHFATRFALLPYLSGAEPPCCEVRALPDCPTCHEFGPDALYPAWSWSGAAVQAGVITSLFYIVP